MVDQPVVPADERRHPAGTNRSWCEAWGFDFVAPAAELGGFARIAVFPRQQTAWFWAGVVGRGRRYLLCRDHDLRAPANPSVLEVRGVGLWMHAICETALEHWTVAMEAFALEFDDPYEAWRSERGDREGLAFDLEWESEPDQAVWVQNTPEAGRYEVACTVNGDLQTTDNTWTIAATGRRYHEWGLLLSPSSRPADPQSLRTITGTETIAGSGPVAENSASGPIEVNCTSGPVEVVRSSGPVEVIGVAPLLAEGADGRPVQVLQTLVAASSGWSWHQEVTLPA